MSDEGSDANMNVPRMHVVELPQAAATKAYMRLFRRCRRIQAPTNGFSSVAKSLVSGRYLYLRNRYLQRAFFLRDDGDEVAALIAFVARDGRLPNSLGGFLALDSVNAAAFHAFLDEVIATLGEAGLLFPLNGHINFGVSALFPGEPSERVGFMTSSCLKSLDHLFSYGGATVDREYLALRTTLNLRVKERLEAELLDMPPAISTRPVSPLHFRRDMAIHNALVNATMKELAYFYPMTDEEWWNLMRPARTLVVPSLFQFLLHKGREVGFCFAFLDFNQVIGTSPDWLKAIKMLALRGRLTRARIFSSGILPEYRGAGMFKYARNRVLLAMFERGIREVESSYVDFENENSIGNVRSKGAQLSHRFAIFRSRTERGPDS